MTFIIETFLLGGRTVGEGHMPVSYVVEELNFFLFEQETSSNRMNGSIAPSLVKETPILI